MGIIKFDPEIKYFKKIIKIFCNNYYDQIVFASREIISLIKNRKTIKIEIFTKSLILLNLLLLKEYHVKFSDLKDTEKDYLRNELIPSLF